MSFSEGALMDEIGCIKPTKTGSRFRARYLALILLLAFLSVTCRMEAVDRVAGPARESAVQMSPTYSASTATTLEP